MNPDTRQQIETALRAFSGSDLRAASIDLLNSLGYQSEKTLDLGNTPDAFLTEFDKRDRKFRKDKALFERWKSVEFLFQIADDEVQSVGGQAGLDFQSGFDAYNYQSYLFFALDLEKNHYTRTQLADITREVNHLFNMPAMLLMRHNGALTFSIIDRRLHKRDQSRDVLEKVKLIKDIRYQEPHRAHIEILHDLSLPALMAKHECRDFEQLHKAWRTTLDTNELNKKFYRELADWYFWALDHVEFPDDVENDEATRNATNVIRLLTRLIFCWFLKEKGLIPSELFSEPKLAGVLKSLKDDDSTYYRAILQNLFFGTLNQRMNTGDQENRKFTNDGSFHERKDEYGIKNLYRYQKLFAIDEEQAIKLFCDIPFLNGGLFDCLDKEDDSGKVVYIDGFTRNARKQPKVPNFLFFSDYQTIDLSDAYGDKKKKKEEVRGLINLLDSYKFTVTENTPIEEEIALDPELLGKVFENLLASYNPETGTTARKQTGSFYTPREIVNYMVDESLIAYLESQLKARVPKLAEMKDLQSLLREVFAYTEKLHPFDEEEVDAFIDAIDSCKILDPACGSGAFPMGILHKLVFILCKLDPNNERWKQKQIDKLDSVSMREELVRIFEDNDDDYGRKLYLIENCIYGVDIQPIAIQISKLRFFISLICDQRTNKNKAQNCGVRPLPNLETKFVAANTLIGVSRPEGVLPNLEAKEHEEELRKVRHLHFSAQTRRKKIALQDKDRELRAKIAVALEGDGWPDKTAAALSEWDPYDQNNSAPFFDAEWMYGIKNGFHVLLGNPPYGGTLDEDEKLHIRTNYKSYRYKYETYIYFIERSLNLAAAGGSVCLITPDLWLRLESGEPLRRLVRDMADFPVLRVCGEKVFKNVVVSTMVFLLRKGVKSGDISVFHEHDKWTILLQDWDSSNGHVVDFRLPPGAQAIIQRIREESVQLAEFGDTIQGITPYDKYRGQPAKLIKSRAYHSDRKIDKSCGRWLSGSDLARYSIAWSGEWLRYGPWLAAPREPRFFNGPRLLFREIPGNSKTIQATYVEDCTYYHGHSITPFKLTHGKVDARFLLGVVNSSFVSWYADLMLPNFSKITFPKLNPQDIKMLPIPKLDFSKQPHRKAHDTVVGLVNQILDAKKGNVNTDMTKWQHEIDLYVYKLYDLSPDEIAIVEGRDK